MDRPMNRDPDPSVLRTEGVRDDLTAASDPGLVLALARFQQEALGEVYRRHAGAVFGLLVIRSGRLGPAIIAHMAFNISTVVVLLWVT